MKVTFRRVFAVIAASIALALFLNYQGVCLSNMRRLSDDEVFRLAIQRAISFDSARRVGSDEFANMKILPYESVAAFREANPNCCQHYETARGLDSPPIYAIDRLLGFGANTVMLNYRRNYVDSAGVKRGEQVRLRFIVGNCGGTIS